MSVLLSKFKMKYFLFIVLIFPFAIAVNWFEEAGIKPGRQVWKIENTNQEIKELAPESWNNEILSQDSYILLDTDILDRNVQYTVRYFIGADSEPVTYSSTKYKYYETRKKTVDEVADLWVVLTLGKINEVPIIRDTYNKNTTSNMTLQSILPHLERNREYVPVKRAFMVANFNKIPNILQIPPRFSELNKEDYFILDTGGPDVYDFREGVTRDSRNEFFNKISVGMKFRDFIYENKSVWMKAAAPSQTMDLCVNEFFSRLDGDEEKTLENIKKVATVEERNPNIQLFQFTNEEELKVIPLTNWPLLESTIMKHNHCYMLVNNTVKEGFIRIGKNSLAVDVKAVLRYGEKLAANNYVVTIIQNENPLPHFAVAFSDIMELFRTNANYESIINIIKQKFH